ncbi:hypothetical protein EMIT0194P_130104 [Pseudomonas serbica]
MPRRPQTGEGDTRSNPLSTADTSVVIQGQNNSEKELIANEQLQLKIFDAVRCLPSCVSEYIWRT